MTCKWRVNFFKSYGCWKSCAPLGCIKSCKSWDKLYLSTCMLEGLPLKNDEKHYTSFSLGNLKHPQSLRWNLKMMVSKRNLLFQGVIFRLHVKLQGWSWLTLPHYVAEADNPWHWRDEENLLETCQQPIAKVLWYLPFISWLSHLNTSTRLKPSFWTFQGWWMTHQSQGISMKPTPFLGRANMVPKKTHTTHTPPTTKKKIS